jgi:hypothetical protein
MKQSELIEMRRNLRNLEVQWEAAHTLLHAVLCPDCDNPLPGMEDAADLAADILNATEEVAERLDRTISKTLPEHKVWCAVCLEIHTWETACQLTNYQWFEKAPDFIM